MSEDTTLNGAVPFYLPIGDEVEIFRAAYECRLPVLLKGPTGCGKTRFVEHMAHVLMPSAVKKSRKISSPWPAMKISLGVIWSVAI